MNMSTGLSLKAYTCSQASEDALNPTSKQDIKWPIFRAWFWTVRRQRTHPPHITRRRRGAAVSGCRRRRIALRCGLHLVERPLQTPALQQLQASRPKPLELLLTDRTHWYSPPAFAVGASTAAGAVAETLPDVCLLS